MIQQPMDVLTTYPVRKSCKQKQAFRDDVLQYARSLGYEGKVDKGSFGSQNVIFGDTENVKYLITAHYDTCARLPFPNLVTPCNFWMYMAYQLLVALLMLIVLFVIAVIATILTENAIFSFGIAYLSFFAMFLLMLIGPANKHNVNDNTSGVITVLQTMASLPENARDQVAFILFDLEEAGLIGSSSYQAKHKQETKKQIILNLDCVGVGDTVMLFPTTKLQKDTQKLESLQFLVGQAGKKSILFAKRGFQYNPSDHRKFPYGVGMIALKRNRMGVFYCSRIHTAKDTILEKENIELLSDKLSNFLQTTNNSWRK